MTQTPDRVSNAGPEDRPRDWYEFLCDAEDTIQIAKRLPDMQQIPHAERIAYIRKAQESLQEAAELLGASAPGKRLEVSVHHFQDQTYRITVNHAKNAPFPFTPGARFQPDVYVRRDQVAKARNLLVEKLSERSDVAAVEASPLPEGC